MESGLAAILLGALLSIVAFFALFAWGSVVESRKRGEQAQRGFEVKLLK